ncbi:MAG: cupredoxin domain-containing protein [Solirubrobacterales bacterium]|nr:cupredoxin domain-containing protein [Solirubrobacterales bacterium]
MKLATSLLASVLLLALTACGSSASSSSSPSSTSTSGAAPSSSSASSTAAAAGALQVTMKDLAFGPATVHARVGQTVKWTNEDSPPHNVTYVSGPKFASSGTLGTGASFTLKLTQAGTIHYFCSIHPFMKATIVVSP